MGRARCPTELGVGSVDSKKYQMSRVGVGLRLGLSEGWSEDSVAGVVGLASGRSAYQHGS